MFSISISISISIRCIDTVSRFHDTLSIPYQSLDPRIPYIVVYPKVFSEIFSAKPLSVVVFWILEN